MQENDSAKFRRKNKEIKRDCKYLKDLVERFFVFLGMKPQPSNEAVRKRFTELNGQWERYCVKRGLHPQTRDLFKCDVEIRWNSLKTSPQ